MSPHSAEIAKSRTDGSQVPPTRRPQGRVDRLRPAPAHTRTPIPPREKAPRCRIHAPAAASMAAATSLTTAASALPGTGAAVRAQAAQVAAIQKLACRPSGQVRAQTRPEGPLMSTSRITVTRPTPSRRRSTARDDPRRDMHRTEHLKLVGADRRRRHHRGDRRAERHPRAARPGHQIRLSGQPVLTAVGARGRQILI
jgi:hypothetical protein